MSRLTCALAATVLACCTTSCGDSAGPGGDSDQPHNSWRARAPLPTPRWGIAVAAVAGQLYAIGGNSGAGVLGTVEAYDPAKNQWVTRAPMPTPRSFAGVGVVGGLIYVFGGSAVGGVPFANLEIYDPATDSWTRGSDMPLGVQAPGAGASGAGLYAVGGLVRGAIARTLQFYDPGQDTWSFKTPLPEEEDLQGLQAAIIEGSLIVFGSYAGRGPTPHLMTYDIQSDVWSGPTHAPVPTSSPAAAALDGLMYFVGGQLISSGGDVQSYDPATRMWTTLASLPTSRYTNLGVLNGLIYAVGGLTTDSEHWLPNVEAYRP